MLKFSILQCDQKAKSSSVCVGDSPLLRRVANFNQLGTSQQLHDQTGRNNWGDTQLHQGTAVGGENDTNPVERIRRFRAHNAEKRDLATDEEDEQCNRRP